MRRIGKRRRRGRRDLLLLHDEKVIFIDGFSFLHLSFLHLSDLILYNVLLHFRFKTSYPFKFILFFDIS